MTFTVSFFNPYPTTSVKQFLEDELLVPRKIRHFLRTKKHFLLNNKPVHWQEDVKTGDLVTLIFDADDYPQREVNQGDATQVHVLYEDEHLIIVHKPEGMKTHGNAPGEIALLNHVSAYVGETCHVVHRLDKETSGAVLFAKNAFILPILGRLLEQKAIQRHYWALVGPHFPKQLTITAPIGRDRHDRRKRRVDPVHGDWARTHATCLKRNQKASLVRCQLDSGRTHQIRVHLSYKGFPIFGDPLYAKTSQTDRLMLHAYKLTFIHPLTKKKVIAHTTSASFEKEIRRYFNPTFKKS